MTPKNSGIHGPTELMEEGPERAAAARAVTESIPSRRGRWL
ncbi:MAG: hypothetical protein ACFFCW_47755 [Candidatus Hodarchaeota archaeon]